MKTKSKAARIAQPEVTQAAGEIVVTGSAIQSSAPRPSRLAVMLPEPPPPPPAPPPPPPAPAAEVQMAENGAALADKAALDEIVVTGSRIRRPGSERLEVQSSPLPVIDAQNSFLAKLQAALRSRDRRRVLQLVRLPLQVRYAGGAVTYRRAAEVRGAFDRIFTPVVEASLMQGPIARDDLRPGQTSTVGRLAIGRACGNDGCKPTAPWLVIAITPD